MTKRHKLTDIECRTAAKTLYDGDGLELQVRARVGAGFTRSWLLKVRVPGRRWPREMGLGPYPAVSLTEARERARAIKSQKGLDPVEARREAILNARLNEQKAKARAVSLAAAIDSYAARKTIGRDWSERSAAKWRSAMERHAVRRLGRLACAVIDAAHIDSALEPIWLTKRATAARVRTGIKDALDHAAAKGWRDGELRNPADLDRVEAALGKQNKKRYVKHHAKLPHTEIAGFMAMLRDKRSRSARALYFAILCACRENEALNARWREFDLDKAAWIIPAQRMKGQEGKKRAHSIPLSRQAVTFLPAIRSSDIADIDYVFPGLHPGKPLSASAFRDFLSVNKIKGVTGHGFRGTFRTWAEDETEFAWELKEVALSHLVGNETSRAYNEGTLFERRRALMQAWADHCDAPAEPIAAGGNVVVSLR